MNGKSRMRPAGFTLVELLVVIGIIAMLLALLMPALTKAQLKAQQTQCASNLRQVGIAIMNYADENDGWLYPYGANSSNPNDYGWPSVGLSSHPQLVAGDPNDDYDVWCYYVLGSWDPPIMICPSDYDTEHTMTYFPGSPFPAYSTGGNHSYMVNEHLFDYGVRYGSVAGSGVYGHVKVTNPDGTISNTIIMTGRTTDQVILMGEKASTTPDYFMEDGDFAAGKVDEYRHGLDAGSNYLFLDLHVAALLPAGVENFVDPWDLTGTGAPTTQTSGN